MIVGVVLDQPHTRTTAALAAQDLVAGLFGLVEHSLASPILGDEIGEGSAGVRAVFGVVVVVIEPCSVGQDGIRQQLIAVEVLTQFGGAVQVVRIVGKLIDPHAAQVQARVLAPVVPAA